MTDNKITDRDIENMHGKITAYKLLYRHWRKACIEACKGDKGAAVELYRVESEKPSFDNQ